MAETGQQMTAEQYINLSKIDSLAKQNAMQAVRIAELEAQIGLIQAQQQSEEQQTNQEVDEADTIKGENPVFEEVDDMH
jgi:hypothetical protein